MASRFRPRGLLRGSWLIAALLLDAQVAVADDLLQVYDAAVAHDADLRSAEALLRSARPHAAQADALLRPNVSAGISAARSRLVSPDSGTDPITSTTTTSANITLRQPVLNGAGWLDVAKARNSVDIAGTVFESTLQDFMVRVAQQYFDVLAAKDILAANRANKLSVAGQLNAAKRNFKAGTGIITDVRDAQARHDLAIAQELAAENDLRVRHLALARLTGRPDIVPKPLAVPVVLPVIEPVNVEAWVMASNANPLRRNAQLALNAAGLDIRRARAEHLPTVDIVGTAEVDKYRASTSVLPGKSRSYSIGVELKVPLFAGLATQNRVSEAVVLQEKARADADAVGNSIAEATEKAFYDLQSLRAQADALEAAEASSRSSLEGTQLGYRSGVRVNLDVLNAQAMLFQTQRDLAKARYDVLMGHLKLRRAAGVLKAQDLSMINALLAEPRQVSMSPPRRAVR